MAWSRQITIHIGTFFVYFAVTGTNNLNAFVRPTLNRPRLPKTSIICQAFLITFCSSISANYPYAVPLLLLHWLWNISTTFKLYTMYILHKLYILSDLPDRIVICTGHTHLVRYCHRVSW
jgi:hypothetical protein